MQPYRSVAARRVTHILLLDMAGNAADLVSDYPDLPYYQYTPECDPEGLSQMQDHGLRDRFYQASADCLRTFKRDPSHSIKLNFRVRIRCAADESGKRKNLSIPQWLPATMRGFTIIDFAQDRDWRWNSLLCPFIDLICVAESRIDTWKSALHNALYDFSLKVSPLFEEDSPFLMRNFQSRAAAFTGSIQRYHEGRLIHKKLRIRFGAYLSCSPSSIF